MTLLVNKHDSYWHFEDEADGLLSKCLFSLCVFTSKIPLGRAKKNRGSKTKPSFASLEQTKWEWLRKMLMGDKETPSLCWGVSRSGLGAGVWKVVRPLWGLTTILIAAERPQCKQWSYQETIILWFFCCHVLSSLYSDAL